MNSDVSQFCYMHPPKRIGGLIGKSPIPSQPRPMPRVGPDNMSLLTLDSHHVKLMWSTHDLIPPYFFFTRNISTFQADALGLKKCFQINYSIRGVNSLHSTSDVLYSAPDIGSTPGIRFIENSTSLFGGRLVTSAGKTSKYSFILSLRQKF